MNEYIWLILLFYIHCSTPHDPHEYKQLGKLIYIDWLKYKSISTKLPL